MVYFDEEDNDDSYSSTSSPSFKFRWDVFLSFRSNDSTSSNFTNRLYKELSDNRVRTFLDKGLETEQDIDPRLLTAIEDSAACVAVISENYASSKWCLEELTKVLDCRRLLLPVFYKVDPSHVRHQNGPFQEAFQDHEQRPGQDSNKVLQWKKAMEKAGGISGWDSRIQDETQLIQSLVKKVLIKMSNTPLGVAKFPIGLDSRVQEVLRLLDVKSNGVQVIGFYGMGGIGKTTLAKAVYNTIVAQFDHRSFISDIREASKKNDGLVKLQNKLIRNLFTNSDSSVNEVGKGIIAIRERIHEKRVLVVLDDVDDVSQLGALAGDKDWYHEGSRIIITTRDSKVLTQKLVTKIYELKELDSTESLQLLSFHAFRRDIPVDNFMSLSEQVVSLTGGLPLALEVLGAFYFDKRTIKEWEDGLEKLKKIRPGNLHDVLKISFDGLDEQEKCIFLDIACFFVGTEMKREDIIDVLKGCGFEGERALTVLTARSLIKVVIHENTLWMHDQLRDMGRQIVQEESFVDPGMRSRLWDHDDAMNVLKYQKGTRSIQGVVLNVEKKGTKSPEKQVKLYTESFAPMVNLRLLQINHAHLEGNFKILPNELKWLQWKECPLEALPSDFCTSELAVLDLTRSRIKHVWDQRWWHGYKVAEKLKVLNLYNCFSLTSSPDLSGHPHLEKLILELCTSLITIHKSIGNMRKLILLNLRDCSNLTKFPKISRLSCLESFVLSGCSKLKELPNDLSSMKSLINLLADGTAIEKLPDSVSHLTRLERLSLNGCKSLKQLPNSIGQLSSLAELSLNYSALVTLPDSIGSLTTLLKLGLIGCGSLATIPDSTSNLKSLSELILDGSSIKNLPASIGTLSHLKRLSVGRCQSLDQLPVSIEGLVSLVELQLDRSSIRELPVEIGYLTALEKLEMRNCKISDLPESIGNMSSLTSLVLANGWITKLPESISRLKKLKILNVNKCKQLSRLPTSTGNLNGLWKFEMEETGVSELPKEFGMLSSLMVLKMRKSPHLDKQLQNTVLPDSFSNLYLLKKFDARYCKLSGMIPDDFGKLTSLEDLKLDYNNFCSLPSSLKGLCLLKNLTLSHCPQLTTLPPLPSSLTLLDLTNCTALESISDLSNLESLQELHLTNCKTVTDVPGLECLNSLRRLYMTGCRACFSSIMRRLPKVALKKFSSLSVPGSEIPKWFVKEVPSFSNRKNREIRDVIVCVVISLPIQQKNQEDDLSGKPPLPAIVDIQAEIFRGNRSMHRVGLDLRGIPDSDEDQIYLCRFLHYTPFVLDIQEGDRIQVTVRNPPVFQGLQLKKYGMHLVFEDDDDADAADDEESLDETEQSVSERLRRFFSSL